MLYTRTSTYRNEVNFFASTLQNQKSPSKKCANAYTYGFNAQEKDDEIAGEGNISTAMFWEYDTRLGRRWNLDPKPQIFVSDYSCFRNNPMLLTDFLGDELDITRRKGFLGLGGKETFKYADGKLYKNNVEYTGKVKGFLKKTVDALANLEQSDEGNKAIDELQNSTNKFNIVKANGRSGHANAFEASDEVASQANIPSYQAASENYTGSNGSGGTIYFNPNSTKGPVNLDGTSTRPSFLGLGHELFHARDANQGVLYGFKSIYNRWNHTTYEVEKDGLRKAEWRAVYYENILRSQLCFSLRTHHDHQMENGVMKGRAPRLLNELDKPINVPIE